MSEPRIPRVGESVPVCGGRPMDKVQRFNWQQTGDVGINQEIHKNELKIDYTYQRESISQPRINSFSAEWDWTKFGRITVSMRPNGEYYIVDGQHRVLAARNRSDVQMLPCVVHQFSSIEEEALAFKGLNVNRGKVSSYHQFRATLVGRQPQAVAINRLVESVGYTITHKQSKGANRTICCIDLIRRCYEEDQSAIVAALQVAATLMNGEHILDDILGGLFFLQRHLQRLKLGSITELDTVERLQSFGVKAIRDAIASSKAYHLRGGHRVCAQGILNVLNRRKRNRIPDMIGSND